MWPLMIQVSIPSLVFTLSNCCFGEHCTHNTGQWNNSDLQYHLFSIIPHNALAALIF